ncbi:Cu(I)-responsive transcriptional regulator [Chelativorans intermedius]|uniref:Cu(I)-responsive transcriptional regulator n=1 Tax=Chelativorans intermedius TaxID=515947 RepID=A0ABV6DBD8_9HYPH|nr:Cu(I)-responsive transcriptional regulator [Chelativorans intermedius]MCT9000287.1 Cu(I)-responsive transcriptional regulator [Chelativorans intermedius]
MNIGEAAQASGIPAKTIRYYEDTGLIPAADRSRSGYRVYDGRDVHTLRFIHRAREPGSSVQDIRKLLALWQDRTRASAEVKALALAHLSELDEKLAKLKAMRRTLAHLVAHCEGDHRPDCPILDDLAGEAAEPLQGNGGLRFN